MTEPHVSSTISSDAAPAGAAPRMLLAGLPSDTHTWNLVYLELRYAERGYRVRNLGCCVPAGELLEAAGEARPDVVVLSTVNGHGRVEAVPLALELRRDPRLAGVPIVVGGKLTIDGRLSAEAQQELLAAGFDAVFSGEDALTEFDRFLEARGIARAGG
ncbi:MAG TPA: cobalamin-dependent protein [Candidatus Elarobacter sp.]|jgi:methylmalonyl-CoA mutase cobalamin-binding subunit|nr:cobalamin-dependent protein [Candidatus Elarobacter sp.]